MPGISSSPRRQSAKAPTPGSTTRSARATCVRIAGDHDRLVVPALARGALEGFRRRVQIAGAVIDDGDAHRWPPGSGNRPMTSDGDGGPRRTGVLNSVGSRRRGRRIGARASPTRAKKRRSAHFRVVADHEAERLPAAARQRPAPQRRGLEADQQRDQQAGDRSAPAPTRRANAARTPSAPLTTTIAEQRQPQPVQQQPQRRQQKGPEMESVAHEHEALGRSLAFRPSRRRCVTVKVGIVVTLMTTGYRHLVRRCPRNRRAPGIPLYPPSEPLVDGTSSLARGSIATAARSARARPLKQDSAIW